MHGYDLEVRVARDDQLLLAVIDAIGLSAASGTFCKLAIVELPANVPDGAWFIQDFDGVEWVAERHRTWTPEGPLLANACVNDLLQLR
jgi:hypothetical protein